MRAVLRPLSALLLGLLLVTAPAAAQERAAARSEDVESIDAIIAALYDVISGPAGQPRNWERFHTLFADGARLIPTGVTPQGAARHRMMTPAEYQSSAGAALERDGFFEREIGRSVDRFGNIAQVFSAYDTKRTLADAEPFMRGINSIQLFHDGTRWWIMTVFWDSERPANPIPARYLSAGGAR